MADVNARRRAAPGQRSGGQFAAELKAEAFGVTLAPATPTESAVRTKDHPDYETKDIFDPCGRCAGTGGGEGLGFAPASATARDAETGQIEHHGLVCFRCFGSRGKLVSQGQLDRREKGRAYRARKAAEQAEERRAIMEGETAEHEAAIQAWSEEHSEVIDGLATLEGDFGDSLRASLQANASLTARQTDAILRIAAEKAAEPDPAPVAEGRGVVTGVIKSIKWQESEYGGSLKMLVLDDRGFKVHGTVPSSLGDDGLYRGDRVSFTGICQASEDDETFGFFKRPTKAAAIGPRVPTAHRVTAPGALAGTPVQVKLAFSMSDNYLRKPSGEEQVVDVKDVFADEAVRNSVTKTLRGQAQSRATDLRELGEEGAAAKEQEWRERSGYETWGDVFQDWSLRDAVAEQLSEQRDFSVYLLDQDTAPMLEWIDDNHPRG
ncbi:hypothetical protein LG293_17235 (plasmid) [Citricoccus nitrophenolicus]